MRRSARLIVFAAGLGTLGAGQATSSKATPPQVRSGIPVNYDEAKVGNYTLPDPLVMENGKRVRDAATWYKTRRPEIVRLFETTVSIAWTLSEQLYPPGSRRLRDLSRSLPAR